MLETSARLLRLLSLLQTPREWSGNELAGRLEVSTRTVRNDVERLRQLGYPVHATRGSAGGYRLGAGASLPPLLLDDEEAVAVAMGLRTAAAGSIEGIEETSLRALAKLEQVLPSRLRRRVNTLQAFTEPVISGYGPTVDPEVLTAIAAACRDSERLRFDYTDWDGQASIRNVEPYRLVSWGRKWYLAAYDIDRQDWRVFRVDRVRPRTPTGPRFTGRQIPDGDAASFVAKRVRRATTTIRARITVYAPATVVTERIFPSVGTVEAVDEQTCVLDAGASSYEQIAAYIGMLGLPFSVDGPPELVGHLRAIGQRYLDATSGAG
jgi:predicted DNA-binding transcriptional regulator YafY